MAEQRLAGGYQLSRVGGEAGRRPGLRGLSKVDELTAKAAGADAGTRVSESGDVLVVNAAVSSRKEGFDDCERVSAPVVPTCETSTT